MKYAIPRRTAADLVLILTLQQMLLFDKYHLRDRWVKEEGQAWSRHHQFFCPGAHVCSAGPLTPAAQWGRRAAHGHGRE